MLCAVDTCTVRLLLSVPVGGGLACQPPAVLTRRYRARSHIERGTWPAVFRQTVYKAGKEEGLKHGGRRQSLESH